MSKFYDLSRTPASVDHVVIEMDIDQELQGIQYLKLTPPSGKMLPPTMMADRKLNKWVQKEWGHIGPVRYCKTPGFFGASGNLNKQDLDRIAAIFCVTNEKSTTSNLDPVRYSKTSGNIGAAGDLNKEELDRIAAMFCVTMPRNNGTQDQSVLKLGNIQVEPTTGYKHKHVLYRAMSAIRRKFYRKIHPCI